MSSRNKTNVKKVFEFWCEVRRACGVDRSTRIGAAAPAGIMEESFPESFRDEKTIADIPAFAFPCEFESDSVQSYSFVLTTDDSKWRFGFCRHDPKSDTAMVIITYLPWHDTFLRLLSVLAELRRSDGGEFRAFLSEAYNRGLPDPGGHLTLFYNGGQSNFVFERPMQFQLPSIPQNHNLNLYYNFVDPKNMIAVFAAMLAERRIIFTSRRLDKLSSCIQAAHAFLYPMVWQHIFIPMLPMKLKDYLSAPMPYLIGVPETVLETMTPDELGEVVILNCDTKILESPFDDVLDMPSEIVSQLKKYLSHSHEHIGDRVSKIFLGVLVQLIGGYRDAVEFRDTSKTFNRDKFIESRPAHLRPFLAKMMELQIFQQFIDERLEMLNTGLGFSDEFELETVRYAEKLKKRGRNYAFLKNVKDKTNPAVKSAVKSVKEGSRGVKTAYKDLKSKFRDITPPNNTHFRSHLASNSHHDRIDGYVASKSGIGHHSAPSSPVFGKRGGGGVGFAATTGGFQYARPEAINGAVQYVLRAPALVVSSSSAHIQPNGHANSAHIAAHHNSHLAASPTVSPASSLCSSEMNLSQELQNHPLFKFPTVDRSLKPSNSLELNNRISVTRTHTGGPLPVRPYHSTAHPLHTASTTPSYYNHPYVSQQQTQPTLTQAHLEKKSTLIARPFPSEKHTFTYSSTPGRIVTTNSIFDNPPEFQPPPVPPVPPRRQLNNNFVVAAVKTKTGDAAHRFEQNQNCWQDYSQCNLLEDDKLRSSSSSNTSAGSSSGSSASFISAVSTTSHQTFGNELPVPAPRLKKGKESLRSLQPQHLEVSHPAGSIHSVSSSLASQEDTMNDLISLDDSNNASFDLEDFDPLNQNARPLPIRDDSNKKSTTLPSCATVPHMTPSSISNPQYPYFTPQHSRYLRSPTVKPPPLPTTLPPPMPPPDEDFELLRKYGLDQFTLSPSSTDKNTTNQVGVGMGKAAMSNWTTFD